jgi:hypothetical protein
MTLTTHRMAMTSIAAAASLMRHVDSSLWTSSGNAM